jgi:hypothetical protein
VHASLVLFGDFFTESFAQGLVGSLIANAIAVVLGIPAGLYLQRLITQGGARRQRAQLRQALQRAIKHNLGTLVTVREMLANNAVPTFSLDLALLDATAHTKYDVLDDIELCATIDHLRFEMEHLDRQIDALLKLELDSPARDAGNFVEGRKPSLYSQVHPQLVESIKVRLLPLEKECNEVLAKLTS